MKTIRSFMVNYFTVGKYEWKKTVKSAGILGVVIGCIVGAKIVITGGF